MENDKSLILNRIKSHYQLASNAELARFLEVAPTTISSWYSRNSIDYDLIFAKCVGVNLNWLITGLDNSSTEGKASTHQPLPSSLSQLGTPLVRIEAFGGIGNAVFSIEEKDIQARYVVPEFEDSDFMIRVKGSSMNPKYNSGDVVACRILRERTFIQWNKVHVIATKEQGILIKRLRKGSESESVMAVSDNKDYDPFDIPWNEITGIALVVGVIRLE